MALLAAIMAAMAAASVATLLLTYSSSSVRSADSKYQKAQVDQLAEGAVEHARARLADLVTNGIAPPAQGTVTIDGTDVDYTFEQLAPTAIVPDADGLQTYTTRYRIEGTATVSGHTAVAHRIVDARAIPLFQFALFYENDLEFWPGPHMTISGRIHSNGDIFLGSGHSLTVDTNYVRAAGDFYNHRKHSDHVAVNDITIRRWVADPYDPSAPSEFLRMLTQNDLDGMGVPSYSGLDSNFMGYDGDGDGDYTDPGDWFPFHLAALDRWSEPVGYGGGSGSTLRTGAMGVERIAVPEVESLGMFETAADGTGDYVFDSSSQTYVSAPAGTGTHNKGAFHEEAGLSVLSYPDGSWKAFNADGDDVSFALADAISTTDLYNARQAAGGEGEVDAVVVDMRKLGRSGYFPANGLLYFGAYGAGEGLDAKGFQIENGAQLAGPLTVVSGNSVYVKGDYNTEVTKPAAVIADAVNLLSNAWDNSKTATNGMPVAEETTFNMSIVTGNIPSEVGNYNGGVENLPRFHENWKAIKCRIVGSITCLWYSKYATGNHSGISNLRKPPIRDWHFDEQLTNLENLPPFTPMSTAIDDVVSW